VDLSKVNVESRVQKFAPMTSLLAPCPSTTCRQLRVTWTSATGRAEHFKNQVLPN
jgi:hypothetical protein